MYHCKYRHVEGSLELCMCHMDLGMAVLAVMGWMDLSEVPNLVKLVQ